MGGKAEVLGEGVPGGHRERGEVVPALLLFPVPLVNSGP